MEWNIILLGSFSRINMQTETALAKPHVKLVLIRMKCEDKTVHDFCL